MHFKGKELAQCSRCIPVSHRMPCDACVNHFACAVCLVSVDANPNQIELLRMRCVELIGYILDQVKPSLMYHTAGSEASCTAHKVDDSETRCGAL